MRTVVFTKSYHGVIPEATKANVSEQDYTAFASEGFVQETEYDSGLGIYIKSICDLQITTRNKENYVKAKFLFSETFKLEKPEETQCEIVSNYLIDEYRIKTIRDTTGEDFWYEQRGVYVPNARTLMVEVGYDFFGKHLKQGIVNKIELLTKAKTYVEPTVFFNNVDRKRIGVANGILNLETMQLEYIKQPSQGNIFVRIPVVYDQTKTCPNFEKFLYDILEKPEHIDTIKELIGYCLVPNYTFEKIYIFTGKGRNGKSKLLALLKTVLGSHNCSSHSLQTLQQKEFCLADLLHKLANIGGDISNEALKATDIIKQITGQDQITANRKFKDYISFVSYAKQIFACNELPMIYDSSLGFWNRINRIDFPYTFYEQQEYDNLNLDQLKYAKVRDENILEKLVTSDELSGILNYALAGLKQLRANKEFSNKTDTELIKTQWLRRTSSFYAFVNDCCDFDVNAIINTEHISELYDMYCYEFCLETVPQNQRANQIRTFSGKPVTIIQKKIDGEKYYVWKGIRLKEKIIAELNKGKESLEQYTAVLAVPSVLAVSTFFNFEKIIFYGSESDSTSSTASTDRLKPDNL